MFSRLAFRYGMRVSLCLLAFGPAAFSRWRTGYYMQDDTGGQTAATIPWTKYTHVIHYALKPSFNNGVCGWDKTDSGFKERDTQNS